MRIFYRWSYFGQFIVLGLSSSSRIHCKVFLWKRLLFTTVQPPKHLETVLSHLILVALISVIVTAGPVCSFYRTKWWNVLDVCWHSVDNTVWNLNIKLKKKCLQWVNCRGRLDVSEIMTRSKWRTLRTVAVSKMLTRLLVGWELGPQRSRYVNANVE